MGGPLRVVGVALAVALSLGACSGSEGASEGKWPEECVLPSPEPGVETSKVRDEFVLPDSEVRQVMDENDLLVIALNVPYGVTESLEMYKERLGAPDYDVISEDNEGFEAELYLQDSKTKNLLAVQIRQPRCTEASAVYVQVDNRER